MKPNLRELMRSLQYSFNDESLLEQALRHRSMGKVNNERLEFLGDSILGYVIAEKLYAHFEKGKEGQLTRLRANLVNGKTLAEIGHELELYEYVSLGPGENKSGNYKRDSVLADAMEAIFAAIYLDSSMEEVKKVMSALFDHRMASMSLDSIKKDPKTRLQEWLQAQKRTLPVYTLIKGENYGQDSEFIVECQVEGIETTVGEGKNRRFAEQEAAQKALELLNVK